MFSETVLQKCDEDDAIRAECTSLAGYVRKEQVFDLEDVPTSMPEKPKINGMYRKLNTYCKTCSTAKENV